MCQIVAQFDKQNYRKIIKKFYNLLDHIMEEEITLSRGCISAFSLKQPFDDIPVLQILGTTMEEDEIEVDSNYGVYLSDGKDVMVCSFDIKLNQLHSSGKLSVFTVVKIDDFKNHKKIEGRGYTLRIKNLTIIANGLEVRKIIGEPTLEKNMQGWLNIFIKKMNIRSENAILVSTYEQKCLNSSDNIAKLSTGVLKEIRSGDIVKHPILQVLTLVKVTNAEENIFNYSVELSDGEFTFNRFYTRSRYFNNLVATGLISEFSIIRLNNYEQLELKKSIKIMSVTVINKGSDVQSKIGNPTPIADGSPLHQGVTDSEIKNLLSLSDLTDSVLHTACVADMQHEVAVSKPILQLINTHRYGEECNLEISDGLFKFRTAMLNSELTEVINSGTFLPNSIIQVDEYEILFIQQSYIEYKPLVNILKLTVVNRSQGVVIGIPDEFESSKGMPENDVDDFCFEKEYDDAGKEMPLARIDEETLGMSDSQIIKHLQEKVNNLSISVTEFNRDKDEFLVKIRNITCENDKLKKRHDKVRKGKIMGKQKLIENNLEITGIQTRPDENLLEIIKKIAALLEVSLNTETEVVSVTRDRNTRAIIATFNNKHTKQRIINGKRGKNLSSTMLNLNIPTKNIRIMEHLTPYNKIIMFEAKNLKEKGIFDFVWSKHGQVLVKSTELDNRAIHIYSLDQLKKYKRN